MRATRLAHAHSSGAFLPTDDPRTDAELIAAINGGDEAAFEAIYRRYRDRVAGLAYRFTHHHDDALDVMQDAFAYFLRKFPGFILTSSLMTFFYPAIKNLAIAARRKRERFVGGEAQLDDLLAPAGIAAESNVNADLASVLASLPPAHREVIVLRFVEGFTLTEIAAALDVPLGTVKSRLHLALRALRDDPKTKNYFAD